MPMVYINYWAVLACGIVALVLGGLWYGPLFGKQWTKLMGWSEDEIRRRMSDPKMKSKMMQSYILAFVAALVMAFVLAHAIYYASVYENMRGVSIGLLAGFMSWLGFIATTTLGMVVWEGRSWKLYFLHNAYWLIQLVIFGVILALWM